MIIAIGMMPGMSTCQIRRIRDAPSTFADSYSPGSTADSAAR